MSAEEPSSFHPPRPPTTRGTPPMTSTSPVEAKYRKRSGALARCWMAWLCSLRGRARVRFSRALGREYPISHLRCEFEVGLSLKLSRASVQTKTVRKVKRRPVCLKKISPGAEVNLRCCFHALVAFFSGDASRSPEPPRVRRKGPRPCLYVKPAGSPGVLFLLVPGK